MQFHQFLLPKFFVKISANVALSKFWNICIGGQSNIGNWPNIGKIFFENIGVDFKKIISVGLYFFRSSNQAAICCLSNNDTNIPLNALSKGKQTNLPAYSPHYSCCKRLDGR